MGKAATIQARIDSTLKAKGERILKKVGVTPSQLINALYAQIIIHKGVPFALKIPNETTLKAMKEAEKGEGKTFDTFEEFKGWVEKL